jgi:hypothetical protein
MRKRRIFRVERLETRQLLAGNVTAALNASGDLLISGDALDNVVVITQNMAGDVNVQGVANTSINGVLNGSATFLVGDLSGNATIDLWAGADELDVNQVEVPGNVAISTGADDDSVDIFQCQVGGSVQFDLGDGTNTLNFLSSTISGELRVAGGVNDDAVMISGSQAGALVALNLSGGNNQVYAGASMFGATLVVSAGAGHDAVTVNQSNVQTHLSLLLGNGQNTVVVTGGAAIGGNLYVSAGVGGDQVSLTEATVAGRVILELGGGANSLYANTLSVTGNLSYTGTDGADTIQTEGGLVAVGGNVTLSLGDGLNDVSLASLFVTGHLVVNGGAYIDRVFTSQSQVGGDAVISIGGQDDVVSLGLDTQIVGETTLYLGAGNDVAGAIDAQVGRLRVFGDAGALKFLTENLLVGSHITITTSNAADADEVFLNTATSARGSVFINTGLGDDVVRVSGATIGNALRVETRGGIDTLVVEYTLIGGLLTLLTGGEDDRVFLQRTTTQANALVDLGAGNDKLRVHSNLQVQDTLTVQGGIGTDQISGMIFNYVKATSRVQLDFESQSTDLVAADFDFIDTLVSDLRAVL